MFRQDRALGEYFPERPTPPPTRKKPPPISLVEIFRVVLPIPFVIFFAAMGVSAVLVERHVLGISSLMVAMIVLGPTLAAAVAIYLRYVERRNWPAP